MSKSDANDLDTTGYFLPEDSQFRLKKLRQHVEFMSHLAQPWTLDKAREEEPEFCASEVAVCLELLAEQIELVLDEVSWPADRCTDEDESDTEATSVTAQDMSDDDDDDHGG